MDRLASPMPAPKLKPDVVFRRLDEGAVLVDLSTSQIFELNNTATRVWEMLNEPETSRTVAERLTDEFDVDPQTAASEVETLLHDLESEGLLER